MNEYIYIYVKRYDDLQLSGRVSKYLCNNRKSSNGKRTDQNPKVSNEKRKVRTGSNRTIKPHGRRRGENNSEAMEKSETMHRVESKISLV